MKFLPTSSILWTFLLIFALLSGCATVPSVDSSPERLQRVQKILSTAKSLLGNRPEARVKVSGKSFVLDCIGTVSAAYWGAGVDVRKDFDRYGGDGVNRLYESLRSKGALHWKKRPEPGDIVFWDNTWDTHGNPLYASGHTHAGIVMRVESDGTIEYLHESVSRGIVLAFMNLEHPREGITPDGRVLNSPMYLGSGYSKKTNPAHWLSGDLWSAFGDAGMTAASYSTDGPGG